MKLLVRGRLDEIENPENYLSRSLTNQFISSWRGPSRLEVPVEVIAGRADDERSPAQSFEHAESARMLRSSIQSLPSRQRLLAEMVLEGNTRSEIAQHLSISPHAVSQLTQRMLRNLKRLMLSKGYITGLLPLISRLKRRMLGWVELAGSHPQGCEALLLSFLLAAVFSTTSDASRPYHANTSAGSRGTVQSPWADAPASKGPIRERSAEESHRPKVPVTVPDRRRFAEVEVPGNRVWIDGDDHTGGPEPPIDEQLLRMIKDPSLILPACLETAPCPYEKN